MTAKVSSTMFSRYDAQLRQNIRDGLLLTRFIMHARHQRDAMPPKSINDDYLLNTSSRGRVNYRATTIDE